MPMNCHEIYTTAGEENKKMQNYSIDVLGKTNFKKWRFNILEKKTLKKKLYVFAYNFWRGWKLYKFQNVCIYITLYVTDKICVDIFNTHLVGTYQCLNNGEDKYFVEIPHKFHEKRGCNGILVCWFYRGGELVRRK